MPKKLALTCAAVLLMLALVISAVGCGEEEEASPTPAPTATAGPTATAEPTAAPAGEITLGAVMDLTGALSGMGPDIRDGVALAIKEINEAGGIDGMLLKLIVEDGATETTKGLEAVKKLVEINGVKVIIGPMISGATLAAGPYVAQRGVLIISPSATGIDIANQDWREFVFRTAPTDLFQGAAMGQLAVEGGYERAAIIVMDNQYGVGIEEVVKQTLEGEIEIVGAVRYDPAKLDYLTELQILKDKNPDVVLHCGYGDDGQILYKQALELGLDTAQWVASEGVYAEATLEMAEAAEFMSKAVIGTKPAAPEGSTYDEFAAVFEAEFGHAPGVYAENSYDAMKLAALAMEEAGSEDAAAISDALLQVGQDYEGVSGIISFADNGDRLGGYYEIWKVVETDGTYGYERIKVISL